jgi:hypothetical protein
MQLRRLDNFVDTVGELRDRRAAPNGVGDLSACGEPVEFRLWNMGARSQCLLCKAVKDNSCCSSCLCQQCTTIWNPAGATCTTLILLDILSVRSPEEATSWYCALYWQQGGLTYPMPNRQQSSSQSIRGRERDKDERLRLERAIHCYQQNYYIWRHQQKNCQGRNIWKDIQGVFSMFG